jgi:hypothetical protein
MLRGMKCEKFIPLFAQHKISLEEFLNIDDDVLEQIGIELPLHRNIIKQGLQDLFCSKWIIKSLYIPPNMKTADNITPVDLIYILSNVLRQTIVMKCQLLCLLQLKKQKCRGSSDFYENLAENFTSFQSHIQHMREEAEKKIGILKRPLLIGKQPQAIKSNLMKKKSVNESLAFTISFMSVAVISMSYFLKK